MKTLLLNFMIALLISGTAHAQSAIAKIKFEEAEEAYTKTDYAGALAKITETENILKTSNQKTMYLKILCEYKLASTDFAIVQRLKKNTASYLTKYEKTTGIEEKFREIYKISEAAKKYPSTPEAFQVWAEQAKAASLAEEAKLKEKNAGGIIAEKFLTWDQSIDGVRLGMTYEEIPDATAKYIDFKMGSGIKKGEYGFDRDCTMFTAKYKAMKIKSSTGLSGITLDKADQRVIHITKNNMVGGKSSVPQSKAVYEQLVAKMKAHFGDDNVVENESTSENGKTVYYSKTANVKDNPVCNYSIVQSVLTFGGILGTECKVTETYTIAMKK